MKKHLFAIFLQMFADEEPEKEVDQEEKSKDDQKDDEPKMVNMTQDEFDKAIEKRLSRQEKKLRSKWEKENAEKGKPKEKPKDDDAEKKDEPNPLQSDLEKSNQELQAANARLQAIENEKQVSKAGIDAKYAEFVAHKVQAMVNDDTLFEEALESFVADEANAHYLSESNKKKDVETGRKQPNQSTGKGVADSMLKQFGYKTE